MGDLRSWNANSHKGAQLLSLCCYLLELEMRNEWITPWAEEPVILSARDGEETQGTWRTFILLNSIVSFISEYAPPILNIEQGYCNVLSSKNCFSVYGDTRRISFQSNTSPNTCSWTVTDVKNKGFPKAFHKPRHLFVRHLTAQKCCMTTHTINSPFSHTHGPTTTPGAASCPWVV